LITLKKVKHVILRGIVPPKIKAIEEKYRLENLPLLIRNYEDENIRKNDDDDDKRTLKGTRKKRRNRRKQNKKHYSRKKR
jgi:hypothetical protein